MYKFWYEVIIIDLRAASDAIIKFGGSHLLDQFLQPLGQVCDGLMDVCMHDASVWMPGGQGPSQCCEPAAALLLRQGDWRPLNTSSTSWQQFAAGMLVVQEARRIRQLPTNLIAQHAGHLCSIRVHCSCSPPSSMGRGSALPSPSASSESSMRCWRLPSLHSLSRRRT